MESAVQKKVAAKYLDEVKKNVDLSKAWSCPWKDLEFFQITPTTVVRDDIWSIPQDWLALNRRKRFRLSVDFDRAVPDGMSSLEAEGLKRRLKRLSILELFQSTYIKGKRNDPGTPATWVSKCQNLVRAARVSLTFNVRQQPSLCPDGPTLFAGISVEDFDKLKEAVPAWGSGNIYRLNALFTDDFFDDWPSADVSAHIGTKRVGSKASDPFTDAAFTEILRAATWLNSIQEDVLQAYLATKDIALDAQGGNDRASVFSHRRERVQAWVSKNLKPNVPFPFKVSVSGEGVKTVQFSSWPVQTVKGLKSLLFLCQTANCILILASTGMRIGEVTALTSKGLEYIDGRLYLQGNTYKTTDVPDGQPRQWPFPKSAVKGLEAQKKLSHALSEGEFLWVAFRPEIVETGTTSLEAGLAAFGKKVSLFDGRCLAELDGPTTAHRFRYSAARYIALSLSGASQVLFDVLGHEDVGVTIGYMLQDRELVEDINKIRREVKAVRSREVFKSANENGGVAAAMVLRLASDMLARSGKQELDTDEIGEAAIILGDAELVKPGILCTAQPLERGACSSVPGVRDVGACTSVCPHHLEVAAHRQTRRKNLEDLLKKVEAAKRGIRVFYQGQIIANLNPFADLIDDFSQDLRLRNALSDCDPRRWAGLQETVRERLNSIMAACP